MTGSGAASAGHSEPLRRRGRLHAGRPCEPHPGLGGEEVAGDLTATVRRADRRDVPRLAEILSAAFERDPFMVWVLPAPETRPRRIRIIFEQLVLSRLGVDRDCFVTLHGAAVWAPPDAWRATGTRQLHDLAVLGWAAGRHASRAVGGSAALERRHPVEPAHWYLEALGVTPEHQGQGVGSRLMRPMLMTCDEDRIPAYLETTTARNVTFYQRLGFEVREEFDLPRGPHIWTMWRDPTPPGWLAGRSI